MYLQCIILFNFRTLSWNYLEKYEFSHAVCVAFDVIKYFCPEFN